MATAEEAKTVAGAEVATPVTSTTKLEDDAPKVLSAAELEAKKKARATRFGIPMNDTKVQIQKSGTATTTKAGANKDSKDTRKRPIAKNKTKELTLEEVEIIKKRSEKFGTTNSEQYLHALAEEKRLKRAARFSTGDASAPEDTASEKREEAEPAAKKAKTSE
ncbi:hypothetical protein SARC_10536 [Sphaeroforma arctica JP610]|uniref:THO1-MOS11 C-terminal domain-containing protein n=1 Tax=Sphaeroforma arctica JP610 TaxID=667725 RepID=A0A0L0FJR0_9EUKA|nr:hypothetical protein SARC_10536 [Sphaeroforma arctica JP610]KNC76995.1 hypothetical protein SARC_10536 [Sphaeroforma arctica JP610]|eukprot:XP_014150897.1 hypothetical protein SARC_10536 [Sphaeroforma arctica JP610]